MTFTEKTCAELDEAGFDYAVAVGTEAEVANGAACGQLSIIISDDTTSTPESSVRD